MKASTIRWFRLSACRLAATIGDGARALMRFAIVIGIMGTTVAAAGLLFDPQDHARWRKRVDAILRIWAPPFPEPQNELVRLVCAAIGTVPPAVIEAQPSGAEETPTSPPPALDVLRAWTKDNCH